MSDDEDYDYYDPVINVVEENKLMEIEIRAVTRENLSNIETAATNAIVQKLEKLNVILKNVNVYCFDNTLLVNDRYGICRDLTEIATAFGFEIKQIDCELRGKSYILQDALVELIQTINSEFTIGNFANCNNTPEIVTVIRNNSRKYTINAELFNIFQTIKLTGHYTVTGTQHIITTYEDNLMIDQKKGEVVSDEATITDFLKRYLDQTSIELEKTNERLQNGTVKLLYSRARQMGYAVKEERKDTQVQLVLVRNE